MKASYFRLVGTFLHISLHAIIFYPTKGQKIRLINYLFIYSTIRYIYGGLSICQALLVLENIQMSLRKGPCFQGPYALTETVRHAFKNPQ